MTTTTHPGITETHALLALLRAADTPADVIRAGGIDGQHITSMIYGNPGTWADIRADIAAGATPADIVAAYLVTPDPDGYPTWNLARRIPAAWPSVIMATTDAPTVAHVPGEAMVGAGPRWAAMCGADVRIVPTRDTLALCVRCHAHLAGVVIA